jgi:hypothetical protein
MDAMTELDAAPCAQPYRRGHGTISVTPITLAPLIPIPDQACRDGQPKTVQSARQGGFDKAAVDLK